MRTRIEVLNRQAGSILMMTLFSAMLIGVVLAGYLTLVQHQEVAVTRSQGWNAALTLAEAGVEEALAQMNSGDLSANGWGPPSGANFNLQSRALAGGRYDVRYDTNTSSSPTIVSIGYVNLPSSSATLSRQVKVSTKAVPLINVAVAAKYGITVNDASGITADSFNSAESAHSDNGRYPLGQATKLLANGDVASVNGPVNLGSPTIKGDLYMGPVAAGGSGVTASQVSGKIYTDFNADYPDMTAPAGALWWTPAMTTNGIHEFNNGGTYTVNDSKDITVRFGSGLNGIKVTLYVMATATNFHPTIEIENSGPKSSSLTIYQVAGTASLSVRVDSQRAEDFVYYGLPGVTSVTYDKPGADFFGVIYAPSANLMLNSGWSGKHFVGACVARSITMNAHYNFHYDENLLKTGPMRGYVAKSWEEL